MGHYRKHLAARMAAVLLLFAGAGCSSTNLGDIDESVDSREQMPGPGIFADDQGESSLQWSSADKDSTALPAETTSDALSEQAEFEQFKIWNQMRNESADSVEYQEFLQWLEYRKFKASQ